MQRSYSERPRRPTRDLPSLPSPIPPIPVRAHTEGPGSGGSVGSSSSDHFATPLASPLPVKGDIVESPISENPLPSSSKETNHQDRTGIISPQHDATTLTPLRAHYLKKELVQLQFHKEFSALMTVPTNNVNSLSYLGPPFAPPPKDGPRLDLPFLRYVFRQFVLSFPFLATAPKNFFPDKLQPFVTSMLSRNLSPTSVLDDNPENSEEAARYRIMAKLERNFTMLLTSGTKLVEREEVVRLTQADLNRLENLARRRAAREAKGKDTFDVNIVCVRTVVEKGRVRSRAHEVRFGRAYGNCCSGFTWDGRNSLFVLVETINQTSSSLEDMVTFVPLQMKYVPLPSHFTVHKNKPYNSFSFAKHTHLI